MGAPDHSGTTLEVLFAPAEFEALKTRDLSHAVCVVFDVLRATSSMVTALANGAKGVLPVEEISEALAVWQDQPGVLLAGERDGVRITADLTSSRAFDLGNSPREFTRAVVAGRTLVMTTTNGTRALRACAGAHRVLASSFLNLQATAQAISAEQPPQLLLVCSGTFDQAAYEDVLAAGAFCELLWPLYQDGAVADSAHIARRLFQLEQPDLEAGLSRSRNGRRLCSRPDLRDDVPFCAALNRFAVVAELGRDGLVTAV